ncbi:MAG: hypothetical protein M1821_007966 [Bathelium mastoideum]|nr:MAG: hypothetical protein M1821_007966 [Bathelium mastoideum]
MGDTYMMRHSDSATLPHPIYPAIATPQSSQARGDWGLKRPLPLRTTAKSSNAALRITGIDTVEHITDFESAADHTKTLEKWQEIGMPVTRHKQRQLVIGGKGNPSNIFESDTDNTAELAIDTSTGQKLGINYERWKQKGPWISGMSESDFAKYLTKIGKHEKSKFLSHLRENLRQEEMNKELNAARTAGRELPPDFHETFNISDAFFSAQLRRLRDELIDHEGNIKLNSTLAIHLRDFFDLPALAETSLPGALTDQVQPNYDAFNDGPPQTHPSAGLSYLRTGAHVPNHPLLGPQRSGGVLRTRILKTHGGSSGAADPSFSRFGVAGVVAKARTNELRSFGIEEADLLAPGGIKAWAEVEQLTVDPKGRIEATVKPADRDAAEIKQGRLPEQMTPPERVQYQRAERVEGFDVGTGLGMRQGGRKVGARSNFYEQTGQRQMAQEMANILDEHKRKEKEQGAGRVD